MEITPAAKIPYTEHEWETFKSKLATTLREKALDSDQIFKDPDVKNFIVSYVEAELLSEKKDFERLALNINIRLVHMDIETSSGKRTFPIINEYNGHNLMKTYYFYKDNSGQCKMGYLEVKDSPVILTL